jgi:hypothetical protein
MITKLEKQINQQDSPNLRLAMKFSLDANKCMEANDVLGFIANLSLANSFMNNYRKEELAKELDRKGIKYTQRMLNEMI